MATRLSITAALCMAVSASLGAQSCPRADSLLGPKTDGFVKSFYDKFTDSTTVVSAPEGNFTMISQEGGAVISFRSQYVGKEITHPLATSGVIVVIAAKSGRNEPRPSTDMQKYGSVQSVNILLDDSVRLTLPVVRHEAFIATGGGKTSTAAMYEGEFYLDVAGSLMEKLYLTVTAQDLTKIGSAKSGQIRFGDNTKKLSGRVLKSVKEQGRVVLCAQAGN